MNKEVVAAVFFNVEKAYDMLWREGLMIKLHNAGVEGKMFNWLMDFLRGRTIQVKVGAELSSKHGVDIGEGSVVSQGSVLSSTLFSIIIFL